jgi:DNA-nicking Smr family endonuclease
MSRRKRTIAPADAALWDAVARTVEPLRPREPGLSPDVSLPPEPPRAPASAGPPAVARPIAAKPPKAPQPPPLSPLDRRLRGKLSRGGAAIDGRIDLHGLTQSVAHRRLVAFLRSAQADGAKVVLVITGKGKAGDPDAGVAERGILKRMVPAWLAAPDLRPMVVGFESAGRAHGGEGALYVRIRRQRAS